MSEFEVGLKLRADGQGLTGQLRLTKDQVRQLNDTLNQTNNAGRKAGDGLNKYGRDADDSKRKTKGLKDEANNLTKQFGSLKGMLATFGLVAFTRDLLRTTAELQNIDTRIRGLSGTQAQYIDNQKFLSQVAQQTRRDLTTLARSYSNILALEKARIVSMQEGRELLIGMIDVQARVGASNTNLGQSMFGLQQALAGNIVRAEELNQITEPLTGLLAELDIAAGLAGGGFRRMVNDGEVTSEFLKVTLLKALETYAGSAAQTRGDLSQIWADIGNSYKEMTLQLKAPLTSSLTPLSESAASFFDLMAANMPFILESLSAMTKLAMVGGGLYLGLKGIGFLIASWPAIVAGATYAWEALVISQELGVSVLQFYTNSMIASTSVTAAFTTSVKLAFQSATILLATFAAGFVVGDWLNQFSIIRVAGYQLVGFFLTQFEHIKTGGKVLWLSFTTAFDESTAFIKKGYAEMLEWISSGLSLVGADELAAVYVNYATQLRNGANSETSYQAALTQLNDERNVAIAKIDATIDGLLKSEAAGIDTRNANRALAASFGDVAGGADDSTDSVGTLKQAQQDLLGKLVPLHGALMAYEKDLKTLNDIVPQSTEEANLKAQAIAALSLAYRNQVKELDGTLAKEKEALRVLQANLQAMDSLIETYAPLQGAEVAHQAQLERLNLARDMGYLTTENYTIALKALQDEYNDLINPAASYLENLELEIGLLEQENAAIKSGNFLKLAELQLRREGVVATDEQIAALADLMLRQQSAEYINGQLTDQANPYAEMWEQSIDRVDRAWFDFVRSGFDRMKSFKDAVIKLAKDLAAELLVIFTREKLFGGLVGAGGLAIPGVAGASTSGVAGGSAGAGTDILSLVAGSAGAKGLIAGAAKLSNFAASGLDKIGLEGLSNMATNQGVKLATDPSKFGALKDIGLSAVAGVAGSYVGDALGEAVFNKQAESNWGAMILGTVGGAINGPLGAFIGSTIGSMLDVAFGGDGMVRLSAGIGAGGPDPVKGKHISGRSELESGLMISHVARRVGDEVVDPLVEVYTRIDSDFSKLTRSFGYNIDYSNLSLKGTNADSGSDADGNFFGLRGENGLPANSAELLQEQFTSFLKQEIANVPGLSREVIRIIEEATGDAEAVLEQYRDLLTLDTLIGAGAQIFTNIESFQETFEVFSQVLQREGESLGDAVIRVGQSMAALRQVGLGDGTSDFASFANDVEAELGLDKLRTLATAFGEFYLKESESLGASITLLTEQATEQFAALNLSIDNFTTLEDFRDQFDAVKDSLDAVDLSKYLQAGVSLGELIQLREQETVAIKAESEAITHALSTISSSISETEQVVNQSRSMQRSMQQDIYRLRGVSPLFPELGIGSTSDRLEAVVELQRLYKEQHAEQIAGAKAVYAEELAIHEARMAAAEDLDKFLRELSFSDLAPISAGERLSLAEQEFKSRLSLARSTGDAGDIRDAQEAGKSYLELARTQYASSQKYQDIFTETYAELSDLRSFAASSVGPDKGFAASHDALLADQLELLHNELVEVEQQVAIDIISELIGLKLTLSDLSTDLLQQLSNIASADLQNAILVANSFNLLKSDVVTALGLLPQKVDLSQVGIANALESLTSIGKFSAIFDAGFSSLASIIGSVSNQLISQGVPTQVIADLIAQNETLTAAANTFLADSGSSETVADYQSKVNTKVPDVDIADYISTQLNDPNGPYNVIKAAIENGIGSGQLANAAQSSFPGITQQEVIAIAQDLGFGSFASGTDRMKADGLNFNHKDEIIFSAPESNTLRSKVLQIVDQNAGGSAQDGKLVAAIERQSELLAEIATLTQSSDSERHEQTVATLAELRTEFETLRRRFEDRAA